MLAARQWIREHLLPQASRLSADEQERLRSTGFPFPEGGRRGVYVLGPDDISIFLEAGYRAIPELIPYVRDHRWVPLAFHYPNSSGIDLTGCTVGKVACYMIEAILRDNPYFTRTAELNYEAPAGVGDDPLDRYAIDRAADAYLAWYAQCYDPQSRVFVYTDGNLPLVNWDYDGDVRPESAISEAGRQDIEAVRSQKLVFPIKGDEAP